MHTPRTLPRSSHRFVIRLEGRLPVYTQDVSEGGFAARLLQPLKRGECLKGTVSIGEWTVPFEGQVVWTAPASMESPRGRFGVHFRQLPEAFRRYLVSYERMQGSRLPRWSTGLAA